MMIVKLLVGNSDRINWLVTLHRFACHSWYTAFENLTIYNDMLKLWITIENHPDVLLLKDHFNIAMNSLESIQLFNDIVNCH